jgi:hypothetical protein
MLVFVVIGWFGNYMDSRADSYEKEPVAQHNNQSRAISAAPARDFGTD